MALNDDVNGIIDTMVTMSHGQTQLRIALEKTNSLLGIQETQIEEIEESYEHLRTAAITAINSVKEELEEKKRLGNAWAGLAEITHMNSFNEEVRDHIEMLSMSIDIFVNAFIQAADGFLSPFLISPDNMKNLLKGTQDRVRRRNGRDMDAHRGQESSIRIPQP